MLQQARPKTPVGRPGLFPTLAPSDLQLRWSLSEQQRNAAKFGGQWPRVSKPTCEA
ncbi:hypothetical protein A2U01_0079835, partial [Trifolium medium]|nr:hypothetical protein [Trifolium medium]